MKNNASYLIWAGSHEIFDFPRQISEIIDLAHKYEKVEILILEAVDFKELNWKDTKLTVILEKICKINNWPLDKFVFNTANCIQNLNDWAKTNYVTNFWLSFLSLKNKSFNCKKNIKFHFSSYVYGCRWPRLWLSSYLKTHYESITDQTFNKDIKNPAHAANLELDCLIWTFSSAKQLDQMRLPEIVNFINQGPILKDLQSHSDQPHFLGEGRAIDNKILSWYQNIFVDIVCETMFDGDVFHPTEKTARSFLTKTPFIVFGPKDFLKNLKKIGFKTFKKYWSEDYDYAFGVPRILEIKKLIDQISQWDNKKLNHIYQDMQPILEHNFNLFQTLDQETLDKVFYKKTFIDQKTKSNINVDSYNGRS